MSDMDKTTENSKVELTDDELDGVQGGISKDGLVKGYTENDSKGKKVSMYQDGSDLRIGAAERVTRKF